MSSFIVSEEKGAQGNEEMQGEVLCFTAIQSSSSLGQQLLACNANCF